MNIVLFSHSYRPEDNILVEHFSGLIQSQGLIPSLDPPSDSVNAAKLERHLNSSDGMVAVLSWRKGGISEYILFEILTCLKARKPLLVFVEDNLPNDIVPSRILQSRFSRQYFIRQIREHKYAIQNLNTYIGIEPPPKYQPSLERKSCFLIGLSALTGNIREFIIEFIESRGYSPIELDESICSLLQDKHVYEIISTSNLAICFIESKLSMSRYLVGAVQTANVPAILLTTNPSYQYNQHIPKEYQPHLINPDDSTMIKQILDTEMNLFEEDIVNLDNQDKVKTYSELLLQVSPLEGQYKAGTNYIFTKELTMRDKYIAGQVGAQGPGSHAHSMTFNQIWSQTSDKIDLSELVNELSELRIKLKEEATKPEHDIFIGAIASAENSAKEGNGPKALEYLSKVGKWALDIATKIGVPVATEALKAAVLGL